MKNLSLLVALVVAAMSAAPAQAALLTNPGFETGDLTGWTPTPGGLVAAVTSATLGDGGTRGPAEGIYFALLTAGDQDVYTTLSQTFAATAGDVLNISAYFDAQDFYFDPYNDDGYVKLINTDDLSEVSLFSSDVLAVGDFGNTPWTAISHTITTTGNYRLEAGVRNTGDDLNSSQLGLDAQLTTAPVPGPSALILLCVAAPILGWQRGRRLVSGVA